MTNRTTVERTSERGLTVTRRFDAPASAVFEAWTTPALFTRWWPPKSMGAKIVSCAMDARTGGGYRLEFANGDEPPMAFYGTYVEVVPGRRLVWTNEESEPGAVTTVSFEEGGEGRGGGTLLTWREDYPSRDAADEAIQGMQAMAAEQLEQLDALLKGP